MPMLELLELLELAVVVLAGEPQLELLVLLT
jgi:hypothetical protein